MLAHLVQVLFSGIAYGVLLFLIAGGLSLTMGLMGFANLAHASFAMLGGYITVTLMKDAGWSFLLALPVATAATAIAGLLLEQTVFRRFYRATELDQVLVTIAIVFMSIAGATYVWGAAPQVIRMPSYLSGQFSVGPVDLSVYRLFLIAIGGTLTVALVLGIERTSFGARIRAAVDNRRMTSSCGIDVDRLFTFAFTLGCALAGLGGALSVNVVTLDPGFPITILVFILFVVVVGGMGSIRGTLIAALAMGVCDVVGKYYAPEIGSFIIYGLAVVLLLWRPRGLIARGA